MSATVSRTHVGAFDASYDDVWAGGWEELFPNDAPGDSEGRRLPDHGEWWTMDWSVAHASDGTQAVVRLVADTEIRKTTCVKEFRLDSDADTLTVSYQTDSRETDDFHFFFKQHLPIALSPSCPWCFLSAALTTWSAARRFACGSTADGFSTYGFFFRTAAGETAILRCWSRARTCRTLSRRLCDAGKAPAFPRATVSQHVWLSRYADSRRRSNQ